MVKSKLCCILITGKWTDSAVAISPWALDWQNLPEHHILDGWGLGVQAPRAWWGGPEVGTEKEQAKDELRKAQSGPQILLRQKYHTQDCWQKVMAIQFSSILPYLYWHWIREQNLIVSLIEYQTNCPPLLLDKQMAEKLLRNCSNGINFNLTLCSRYVYRFVCDLHGLLGYSAQEIHAMVDLQPLAANAAAAAAINSLSSSNQAHIQGKIIFDP